MKKEVCEMSRKPFIAGNWKMNKNPEEAKHSLKPLHQNFLHQTLLKQVSQLQQLIWQLFLLLLKVQTLKLLLKTATLKMQVLSLVKLAHKFWKKSVLTTLWSVTQNVVTTSMKPTKISTKKAKAIFANGMLPIICCGESLETYEAGKAAEFVGAQVSAALAGLTAEQVAASVIAYEPIWAIGTGKSASQDDAQKMCKVVRDVVAADFGQEVADKVRVQYGGSVKPENVASYMACPDVDGALVGGASLEAESFLALLDFVK